MLRQGVAWICYGDRASLVPLILGGLLGLSLLTLLTIQPLWSGYDNARNNLSALQDSLNQKQAFVEEASALELPSFDLRPLPEIGKAFGLMMLREDPEWYFSGRPDQLFRFLIFLLTQGYPLQEFRLVKMEYNLLLAVRL